MASYTTKFTGNTVYAYLRNEMRKRTRGLEDRPHGHFVIDTGTISLDGTTYITDNDDLFELLEWPSQVNIELIDWSVTVNDMDQATSAAFSVLSGTTELDASLTTAQAGGTVTSRTGPSIAHPLAVTGGDEFKLKFTAAPATDQATKTARAKVYVYVIPGTVRTLVG